MSEKDDVFSPSQPRPTPKSADAEAAPSGPSTVERVARAVRRRRFERTGRPGSHDESLPLTDNELDDARAAIEAMREPTDAMTSAAADLDTYPIGSATPSSAADDESKWRAMIDTALSEGASER